MHSKILHIRKRLLTIGLLLSAIVGVNAQEVTTAVPADTLLASPVAASQEPTVASQEPTVSSQEPTVSSQEPTAISQEPTASIQGQSRDWGSWRPDPKRAMWLALVIPGGGQIYNHKYWKLPIVYGGFVGCAYAMRWNNMMYRDYSQAYMDLLDNDPQTDSYNQFMHLGMQINASNQARYEKLFKARKDRFRRWRDMSFFVLIGVYAISVIDAYVDASLSEFDITDDLTLHIDPVIVNDQLGKNPLKSNALGLQCSINF